MPGKTHELVLATGDVGDVHVVSGGRQIFELLAGEDVNGDKMDLGVTVLAGLRGGHVDNLAGAALDDDVTVLPQSRALHGKGGRGTGIGGLESVLLMLKCQKSATHSLGETRCSVSCLFLVPRYFFLRGTALCAVRVARKKCAYGEVRDRFKHTWASSADMMKDVRGW